MNTWISQNVPVGEPVAVLVDHRFAGWACGGKNAIRAREFTKPAIQPRTLWPSWDDVSAEGWPIQGIWEPIAEFEVSGPSIHEIARGYTGDGCDALD